MIELKFELTQRGTKANSQVYRGETAIYSHFKPKENPLLSLLLSLTNSQKLSHSSNQIRNHAKPSFQSRHPKFSSSPAANTGRKMANLRTAMDATFWDLNISTPQNIDGVCKAIPGDPIPLDGARASRALRFQQVSLLGNGFPLGIIPSFSPSINHKELGSLALQSLIGRAVIGDWYQFRNSSLLLIVVYSCFFEIVAIKGVG